MNLPNIINLQMSINANPTISALPTHSQWHFEHTKTSHTLLTGKHTHTLEPVRSFVDSARGGRARQRTESYNCQKHTGASPNITFTANIHHGFGQNGNKRATGKTIDNADDDQRSCWMSEWPGIGCNTNYECCWCHDIERTFGNNCKQGTQVRGGALPITSASTPANDRPKMEVPFTIATK